MRWSVLLLPAVALVSACSSTAPSPPRYQVTVTQTLVRSGDAGAYLRDVIVRVTTAAGEPAPRVGVGVQFTAGRVEPLPLVTDADGNVSLTWIIPASEQMPGSIYALGFCAHDPGETCSVDLTSDEVVSASF